MNWVKRKILLTMVVLVMAPLVAAALPPVATQAADGGSALWVDKETIRYPNNGGDNSGDPFIKNGDNFFRQGDLKNLCSGETKNASDNASTYAKFYQNNTQIHVITEFSSGDSHAIYRVLNIKLYDRYGSKELTAAETQINSSGHLTDKNRFPAYYGCKKAQADSQIVLQQAQHATEGYHWVSKTQIETSDSSNRLYTQGDNGNYDWQGDSNTCKEYLEIQPPSATGTLHYGGVKNGGNQCQWKTRTVGVSTTENADKDPVDSPDAPGTCNQDCQSERNCATASKPFAWIFCPAIKLMNNLLTSMFNNFVVPLLRVTPLDRNTGNCNGSCTYKVWEAFKNLANAAFVLIFLIIIFANVASIKIDSYTVKKMLPKLVAAAILLQFSFVFSSFLIDIGNVLGAGINGIITTTLKGIGNSSSSSSGGQDILSGIATGTAIGVPLVAGAIIAGPTLLIMGLGLVVSVLIFVATLAVRQIAITMLVVLSPIAIMLWVLPNTEKYFKDWLENFIKLVLMYPIIMLIVGAGRIIQIGGADAGGGNIKDFFVIAAPTISLLMLPAAFKVAGSILQRGAGLIGGKGQGLMGGVKNSQMAKDMKSGYREKNFMRSQDEHAGKTGRFLGRVATGNLMPGRASQRRLMAGHATAVRTRGDEHEVQMLNEKYSADDLHKIATSKTGATVNKTKVDEAARTKAIELLARNGEYRKLADVKSKLVDPSTGELSAAQNRTWSAGLQKNIGDVFQKAPDLVAGTGVFKNMSAEKLANLDESTAERMVAHLATPGGAAYKPIIMAAINQLSNSPALKVKVDQRVVGVLSANRAVFSGTNVDVGSGKLVDGSKFLAPHDPASNPDGKIGSVTTETDPTGRTITRTTFK